MLFHLSIFALLVLIVILVFRYKPQLIQRLPLPNFVQSRFPQFSHYTPLATFADQRDAGLSSSAFDIEANINDGDARAGLDEQGTQEVMAIMRRDRVNFDQARLTRHNEILARNGIDPSGMPMDSKAITHL